MAEAGPGDAAQVLASQADRLLFYPDFLTTEAFLRLDDDLHVQQKILPETHFTPPPLPEDMTRETPPEPSGNGK